MDGLSRGFKFHAKAERVFNPVSVGKCLVSGEFKNYWFETGTPTFLVNLIKEDPVLDAPLRISDTFLSASRRSPQASIGSCSISRTSRSGRRCCV